MILKTHLIPIYLFFCSLLLSGNHHQEQLQQTYIHIQEIVDCQAQKINYIEDFFFIFCFVIHIILILNNFLCVYTKKIFFLNNKKVRKQTNEKFNYHLATHNNNNKNVAILFGATYAHHLCCCCLFVAINTRKIRLQIIYKLNDEM